MTEPVKPPTAKRRYNASRRRAKALETRNRIAQAARRVFLQRGYAAAYMAEIAAEAGVSMETVYATFGPKSALVRHLVDRAISGTDEYVTPLERPWVQEVAAEPDARRKVERFAEGVRRMQERLAPLWSVVVAAAAGDAELRALVEELNARRVGHMRLFVDNLAATGGLRPGLTAEVATDVIWAMTSAEFFVLLVLERGWHPEAFEVWIADAWKRLLLA